MQQHEEGLRSIALETLTLARQEISRQDLSQWDASARAWLQVADDAELRRQKQLMLIVNNIDMTVNKRQSTFDSVLEAWKTAAAGLERLITGGMHYNDPRWREL